MTEIRLEKINKTIKGAVILKDVDLEMKSGNIYGFRGKNGCGKTMLMRMISGLILPTSGKVFINGKELHKDIKYPESIGALIENPAFIPRYTGYKNLKMLAELDGNIKDEDILKALDKVGLDPNDKRTYRKYSLGMKQKLGIANAIMGEPDIILLDEPINALDEESVKKVREYFRELRDAGKLLVVACHDREELEYLSDKIVLMKEGMIEGITDVGRSK